MGFSVRVIAAAERYVRHLCDNQVATMIPIRLTAIVSMVFAAMCLWFAIDGFTSLADNPEQVSGGRSFAWFWSFLAGASLAIAWLSWRFAQTQTEDKDA